MILAIWISSLLGCNDPYDLAMEIGTIESIESFAQEHPEHRHMHMAKFKLEQLYVDRAKESGTVEAWDDYLERYPEGQLKDKGVSGRKEAIWSAAESANTPEAWNTFLEEYPKADRDSRQDAKRRMKVSGFRDTLAVGEVGVEPVNLGEDPNGPYDGYAISADVHYTGEKPIIYLDMLVEFLGADDRVLHTERWPLVGPRGPKNVPIEEEWKVPVQPDETRRYFYTTEGPQRGNWERKARLVPVAVKFEGDKNSLR